MSDDRKSKKFKKISEMMGIENDVNLPENVNLPVEKKEEKLPEKKEEDNETDKERFKEDFDESRETLKRLSSKSENALDNLIHMLYESESPRAYEVASGMVKNIAELQKDLMELHEKRKKMLSDNVEDESKNQAGSMNIERANIVVGTTSQMLKKMKEEDSSSEDQE